MLGEVSIFRADFLTSSEVVGIWDWQASRHTTQNMAPWHAEYFKLKEFEKWQVQEGVSALPLKQVTKPSCEVSSLYLGWGNKLISKTSRGIWTNSPCCFPWFTTFRTTTKKFISYHIFLHIPFFLKPSVKPLRFNYIFRSSFPSEGSCVM